MTPADGAEGRSVTRLLTWGLRVVLFGLIGYGALASRSALVVNGLLAVPIAFSPALLERQFDHEISPALSLWITVAAVVHVAGFFGPYTVQSGVWSWYDQAAHAISASFVAGVGYAVVLALDRGSRGDRFPPEFRFVFTLCFIMAFGVAWEIAEFGAGELSTLLGVGGEALVQYGMDDIVSDLVFNTLAAVAVALWGTHYFTDIAEIVSNRLPGSRTD